MSTYVKKCLEYIQKQVDEEGLTAISAVNFARGGTPIDVLKSKQLEYRLYTGGMEDAMNWKTGETQKPRKGKYASIAGIAKDMLAMFEAPVICSTTYYPDGREPTHTGGGIDLDSGLKQKELVSPKADEIISRHLAGDTS